MFITCIKEESSPNSLGGETNIALTAKDSVTNVYGSYDGNNIQNASLKVKSNDNGIVTYEALIDISTFSDALKIKAITSLSQLSNYYKFDTAFTLTPDNKLKFVFKPTVC